MQRVAQHLFDSRQLSACGVLAATSHHRKLLFTHGCSTVSSAPSSAGQGCKSAHQLALNRSESRTSLCCIAYLLDESQMRRFWPGASCSRCQNAQIHDPCMLLNVQGMAMQTMEKGCISVHSAPISMRCSCPPSAWQMDQHT